MAKTIKNKAIYESDINGINGKASSVAIPERIEELQGVVRLSQNDVVPRGSGTSFTGGVIPDNSSVIDMSLMNHVLKINPARKTAHVQAGVTVAQLNYELEKFGLEFPIIPLFPEVQTIGGLIALNCPGDREIKYGRMANWVDSLEVVDGRGNTTEFPKSESTEFIGLEGTTGIIASAKLRLTTKKQRTISVFRSNVLEELFALYKKLRLELAISMILLVGKKLSSLSGLGDKYHLLVEFENNSGTMKNQAYDKLIKLKEGFYQKMASSGYTLPENPKLFSENVRDLISFLEHRDLPYFANIGSGSVFACFKPEDPISRQDARELVKKMRCSISHSFGIGLINKDFIERNDKEILRRIKKRHDPHAKFNRNKILDFEQKPAEKQIEEEKSAEEAKPAEEIKPEIKEKPVEESPANNKPERTSIQVSAQIPLKKNVPQLTEEEKEKIRKIAGGYF